MHDAAKMGAAFVKYLKKLSDIKIMYIAAPPDEMDMLNRVKLEIMKKLPTLQIYLSTQVRKSELGLNLTLGRCVPTQLLSRCRVPISGSSFSIKSSRY